MTLEVEEQRRQDHAKQPALFSHPSWTALVDAAISTLCSVDVEVFLPHRPQESKDPPSLHGGKRWLVHKKDLPPPVLPFGSWPSFTLGPHFLPSKGLYQFLVPHKSFTVLSCFRFGQLPSVFCGRFINSLNKAVILFPILFKDAEIVSVAYISNNLVRCHIHSLASWTYINEAQNLEI